MGYHVIYNTQEGALKSEFVENEEDLLSLPLTNDCIIYKGIKEWSPKRLGDDSELKLWTKDWFKAGKKAEKIFYKKANDKYIVESISQDLLSFESYRNKKGEWLKRGDFLLRDVFNLEIEVKCLNLKDASFLLRCDHHFYHKNMQDKSKIPILFAIFERDGENVASNKKLYMISNYKIEQLRLEKKLGFFEGKEHKYYKIPLSETKKDFILVEDFRKNISIEIK